MKPVLFFLCFLCSFSARAQTVFAPPRAIWHFENIPDLEPPGQNYIRYAVEKDTLLYGRMCSKIPGVRIQINKEHNGYDTLEQPTQYTYTSGDTVFYYNHVFSRFLVLYNFDVKVGDTVTYHVPYKYGSLPDTTFQIEIKDVYFINIDGKKLKVIYSRALPKSLFAIQIMIERIGYIYANSISGYNLSVSTPDADGIRCYSDVDIDTNMSAWEYGCEELESLGLQQPRRLDELKLHPNPAQQYINLEYPAAYRTGQFTVVDQSGRALPVPRQLSGNAVTFDLSSLPPGLYYLEVLWPDGIRAMRKFAKF